jgi:hypothetical protein
MNAIPLSFLFQLISSSLQFNFNNFTNIHLLSLSLKPRAIPDLTPLESQVQSAASALTVALPAATSKVQSSIGAATSDLNAVTALILRNYSFRTKQFCVRFVYNTAYSDLLLNFSDIIPEAVTSFTVDEVVQSL